MSSPETGHPAVVCDMTGAPDSGEERLAEYGRLLAASLVARDRTATHLRWVLRDDPGIAAWARDLAARESACCAFLTITVTTRDGHVLWDCTTIDDPAARAVLDLFHDLPEGPWTTVGAVLDRLAATGVPAVVAGGVRTGPGTGDPARSGRRPGPQR
jgi:hypothetical protein